MEANKATLPTDCRCSASSRSSAAPNLPRCPIPRDPRPRTASASSSMAARSPRVMGHPAIDWLERDEREKEEAPSRAIAAIDLKPTDVIADIGCRLRLL